MRQDKLDRLDIAAELRVAIWTYLRDNPASLLTEIMARFTGYSYEAVRKAVYKLRRDLNVMMVGSVGKQGRYSATNLPPKTAADSRKRLATAAPEACHARAATAAAASKAAREQKRALSAAPGGRWGKPGKTPGSTVYIGGCPEPMSDQRGQGAVARPATIRVGHY